MPQFKRYLKITEWARKRSTVNGTLVIIVKGQPSNYTLIENLAATKLLGFNSHYSK